MGLFGVPPRAADQQAMGRRMEGAACSSQSDEVRRGRQEEEEEEYVVAGSCRLGRSGRWESDNMSAAAAGRSGGGGRGLGRKRSSGAAGGGRGEDRLMRNRGRRGRALVGTAIISAMTLSQGEGVKRRESFWHPASFSLSLSLS